MDDNVESLIAALINARFEGVKTRFEAMDEANKVLSATVTRVPTDLQTAISGVDGRMKAQDDKTNVAIQALKDAAKDRWDSNTATLMKTDTYMLSQQAQLTSILNEMRSTLSVRISALEAKVATSEASASGARNYRDDAKSNLMAVVAVISVLIGVGGVVAALITNSNGHSAPVYTLSGQPPPVTPQVSVVPVVPVPVQPGR
jgi:hypothetical protein